MKFARSENTISLIPETVKEALRLSKMQKEMHDDGYDATEVELAGADTSFLFAVLRRPGPKKRQQPEPEKPLADVITDLSRQPQPPEEPKQVCGEGHP